jgi:hypothetical protein
MLKSKWNFVLAFVACALLLPLTANAKDQQKRPFTIRGDVTVTTDFSTYYYAWATGVATHIGNYRSESLRVYPPTGIGIATAANGDELYWIETVESPIDDPSSFKMFFRITGGTGRFKDASGSFSSDYVTPIVTPDPDHPGGLIITFSYSATGTITY